MIFCGNLLTKQIFVKNIQLSNFLWKFVNKANVCGYSSIKHIFVEVFQQNIFLANFPTNQVFVENISTKQTFIEFCQENDFFMWKYFNKANFNGNKKKQN